MLDESFNQTEIGGVNLLLNHAGVAMPIYVNLALHGTERVTREVQNGMQRFVREKLAAMRSAENVLRNVLRGEVTAILLNSELAMREPSLSEHIAARIEVMHDLAETMRLRLEKTWTRGQACRWQYRFEVGSLSPCSRTRWGGRARVNGGWYSGNDSFGGRRGSNPILVDETAR